MTLPSADTSHADHRRPAATTQAPPAARAVEIQAQQTELAEQRTCAVSEASRLSSIAGNNIQRDGAEHTNPHVKILDRALGQTHEPFVDGRVEPRAPTVHTSKIVGLDRIGSAQALPMTVRPITDEDLGLRVLYDGTHVTPQPEAGGPVE